MSQSSTSQQLGQGKPPRNLGSYQLVAELARGGMGRVYLARKSGQAGFERFFAVKVMHHQLNDDQDALLMLLDEAHIASRLHHPNVVPVLDIGTYEDGYYLVMDYVEGCSLQELLKRNRADRPARLILPIMIEALNGLHAVHTLKNDDNMPYGIVHRDISPHNLLVGVDGACRVIDFGIAKATARFADTRSGMFKGKLAYMSPEQLMSEDIDPRADVWATGVTLYDALTAKHPFKAGSDPATLHNVLRSPVPPPSEAGLRAPACLDAVIMKALERDPKDRYQSAGEFADALRKAAMANDMLGAPNEVAEWVRSTYGEDLSERKRKIRETNSSETSLAGHTPSLPRLWLASGSQSLRTTGEHDLTQLEGATPSTPSIVGQSSPSQSNPSMTGERTKPGVSRGAIFAVAGVGLAAGIAGAVILWQFAAGDDELVQENVVEETPRPEEPSGEPPTAEEEAGPSELELARPPDVQPVAQEPPLPEEPQPTEAQPSKIRRPRPRVEQPAQQTSEAPANPPPQQPTQETPRVERNPYLRGE
jgi:serine/threonine protein kinase